MRDEGRRDGAHDNRLYRSHPEDLTDLLARSGIDLIAERVESEGMVVDLLDYDVRFAPPGNNVHDGTGLRNREA
jgi:hypothetical protein